MRLLFALCLFTGCVTHRIYVRGVAGPLTEGVVYTLPRALVRVAVAGDRIDVGTVMIPDPSATFALSVDGPNSQDWLETGQWFSLDEIGALRAINSSHRAPAPSPAATSLAVMFDPSECSLEPDGRQCVRDVRLGERQLRVRLELNRARQSPNPLRPEDPAREGFVYRVPANVPITVWEGDKLLTSAVIALPQYGTLGLATVHWRSGSDAILSARLGADGSLREYRVNANTYIDKALGKGFSGLENLFRIVRELKDGWTQAAP
jgi:hypothetical protein